MLNEISDNTFVNEMRLLWSNNVSARELMGCFIQDYFEGKRADRIINKMQEKLTHVKS